MEFHDIQEKIEDFCSELRLKSDIFQHPPHGGLPLSDAIFCAEDRERNLAFFHAIFSAAKKISTDFIAIDAGAGLGILGFFALFAGAQKVCFVEINPNTLIAAQELFKRFGFKNDQGEFFCSDMCDFHPSQRYDMIISETISSGFVAEDFPKIMTHIKPFATDNAIFIPERFEISAPELNDTIFLSSQNFPKKIRVVLKDTPSKTICFSMTSVLFENQTLKTTISFGNPRIFSMKDQHPLFDFQIPSDTNAVEQEFVTIS